MGSVKFIYSMQLQLKRAKQQRNNSKSVAEEKQDQGQEGVEGHKGTRRQELVTETRLTMAALEDCAGLGMGAGRGGGSSPAAFSEQTQDALRR